MDYVKPTEMFAGHGSESGAVRAKLSITDMLVRGMMAGALLGIATSLAVTGAVQTGVAFAGALIFPVGFVMIVVLGLELVTGNFAFLAVSAFARRCSWGRSWAELGVGLHRQSARQRAVCPVAGHHADQCLAQRPPAGVAQRIMDIAVAKTTAYQAFGAGPGC